MARYIAIRQLYATLEQAPPLIYTDSMAVAKILKNQ